MNAFFKYVFIVTTATTALFSCSHALGFPLGGVSLGGVSQSEISWGDNLSRAQVLARHSAKPILVHFFSDTCPPCKMMDKHTFPNPEIAKTVQSSFIPVKLNVRQNPREAQMFNVQSVPTDIVLSPDGQKIHMAVGGHDVSRYGQFLTSAKIASVPYLAKYNVKSDQVATVDQIGTVSISGRELVQGNRGQGAGNSFSPETNYNSSTYSSYQAPSYPDNQLAMHQPKIEAGGACPINETPSFDYNAIPEEERARIEFEGYCPVELGDHSLWIRGDYNIRYEFEGRLYLFAGKAQLEKFRKSPKKYAPAYKGIDIVVWKERGVIVRGTRNFGAWAFGRVFLFSSEENLIKFEKNAKFYITPTIRQ